MVQGNFRLYAYLMKRAPNPFCLRCGEPFKDNPEHLFFECTLHRESREKLWNTIGNPKYEDRRDMRNWLLKDNTRIRAVYRFLVETKRFEAYGIYKFTVRYD